MRRCSRSRSSACSRSLRRRAGSSPALEARADVDPLTELPNRRAFERELARSLAYVKRHGTGAALLYLDLDDFKRVNDRHGHSAGDAVLRAVASVLGRHVRGSDVVARIGGDEFALLLWNCDEADAAAKALALETSIGRTIATHAGVALTVGASVGTAALLPLDEPALTIGRADRAMYARKAARRAAPRRSDRAGLINSSSSGWNSAIEPAKSARFCRSRHNVPHSQNATDRLSESRSFHCFGGSCLMLKQYQVCGLAVLAAVGSLLGVLAGPARRIPRPTIRTGWSGSSLTTRPAAASIPSRGS